MTTPDVRNALERNVKAVALRPSIGLRGSIHARWCGREPLLRGVGRRHVAGRPGGSTRPYAGIELCFGPSGWKSDNRPN